MGISSRHVGLIARFLARWLIKDSHYVGKMLETSLVSSFAWLDGD